MHRALAQLSDIAELIFFLLLTFRAHSEKTAKAINAKPEHKMYVWCREAIL